MKKILIWVFILIFFISCKKDVSLRPVSNEKCYHCQIMSFNGISHPDVDYCGTDGGTKTFTDDSGNELNSFCTEK